jgi:hypothetical protein
MKSLWFSILLLAGACSQDVAPSKPVSKNISLDDSTVLILVEGKETTSKELLLLDTERIESIEVLKGDEHVRKYTSKEYKV